MQYPAEPVVTQYHSFTEPAKSMCEAKDVNCVLGDIKTVVRVVRQRNHTQKFLTVNEQSSP